MVHLKLRSSCKFCVFLNNQDISTFFGSRSTTHFRRALIVIDKVMVLLLKVKLISDLPSASQHSEQVPLGKHKQLSD